MTRRLDIFEIPHRTGYRDEVDRVSIAALERFCNLLPGSHVQLRCILP